MNYELRIGRSRPESTRNDLNRPEARGSIEGGRNGGTRIRSQGRGAARSGRLGSRGREGAGRQRGERGGDVRCACRVRLAETAEPHLGRGTEWASRIFCQNSRFATCYMDEQDSCLRELECPAVNKECPISK